MKKQKKVKSKIVSLDIGEDSIKVAYGRLSQDRLTLHKTFSFKTPLHSVENGHIANMAALVTAIKSELDVRKIKKGYMNISFGSTEIIDRELTLPHVKENELKEMVRYEIQQYLPIDFSKYVVQHKILEEVLESGVPKYRIMASTIKRETVEAYLSLIEQLGFKPYRFDIHSNALDKVFWLMSHSTDTSLVDKRVVILDFGHRMTSINIFESGVLKMNQTIPFGGHDLDMAIERATGIDALEANQMKEQITSLSVNGELEKEEEEVKRAITQSLRRGLSEVQSVLRYYITRTEDNKVDEMYIYGGFSKLGDLDRYLEELFSVEVKFLRNIPSASTDLEDVDVEKYVNAIGAIITKA